MANETESGSRSAGTQGGSGPEGVLFSLQALVGFTLGGLIAVVVTLAAGLYSEGWASTAGRIAGFAACGTLGGAALGVGLRPGAWKSGALGFGLSFAVPAILAGPALTHLLALRIDHYGSNTFVVTCAAFSFGYGLAGALGAAFLDGKLALPIGLRFFAAAGLGGLIAACGPALAGDPSAYSPSGVIAALFVVVAGHMTACSLGGWLAGLAMEAEVKARAAPRVRTRAVAIARRKEAA
jgi:hypothetical protein